MGHHAVGVQRSRPRRRLRCDDDARLGRGIAPVGGGESPLLRDAYCTAYRRLRSGTAHRRTMARVAPRRQSGFSGSGLPADVCWLARAADHDVLFNLCGVARRERIHESERGRLPSLCPRLATGREHRSSGARLRGEHVCLAHTSSFQGGGVGFLPRRLCRCGRRCDAATPTVATLGLDRVFHVKIQGELLGSHLRTGLC